MLLLVAAEASAAVVAASDPLALAVVAAAAPLVLFPFASWRSTATRRCTNSTTFGRISMPSIGVLGKTAQSSMSSEP